MPTPVLPPVTPPVAPPVTTSREWTLVWADEFAGAERAPIDQAKWRYDTGTAYPGGPSQWGTGEIETMTAAADNVSLDGMGHLAITPLRAVDGRWTSGRIETQRVDFRAPVGGALAVEFSIELPAVTTANGLGYWPAAWMLGGAYRDNPLSWPSIGEIDVMEAVNGRGTTIATLHCGSSIPGPCNEYVGLTSGEVPCDCQVGFHVFRAELDRSVVPQVIRWYRDGTYFHAIQQTAVDPTTWAAATSGGFMILLNVSIGGALPSALGGGPTVSTVSGKPMRVDYVRVYQRQ